MDVTTNGSTHSLWQCTYRPGCDNLVGNTFCLASPVYSLCKLHSELCAQNKTVCTINCVCSYCNICSFLILPQFETPTQWKCVTLLKRRQQKSIISIWCPSLVCTLHILLNCVILDQHYSTSTNQPPGAHCCGCDMYYSCFCILPVGTVGLVG